MRKMALVLLAACGGGSDNNHMVVLEPDAAPDVAIDAPPRQPVAVEFDVYGTPAFIAYRDGSGAWQTPTDDGQGAYTLMVTDDYQVVVTCTTTGQYQSTLFSQTVDDGQQYAFCSDSPDTQTTVAVTGTMQQAGQVFMEDEAESATANWNVALDVSPRTHDLIAVDTGHHMLIRRGLSITGATTLDPIDLTAADAMTPITLTLNGLAGGEMMFNAIELLTANDFAEFQSSTTSLYAPPSSLLGGSDYEFLIAEAYSGTQYRYAETQFSGTETTFTLPDPVTGITFGKGKATWTTFPAMYDGAQLTLDQDNGTQVVEQVVQASRRWIDKTQATALEFDVQPPGYDAAWNVDTGTGYSRQFSASYQQGNTGYGVGMFDTVTARQRAKRPWFSAVARVRASMRSQHTMPRR
jgi:hypothetical protein